jgi:hypothetical protein
MGEITGHIIAYRDGRLSFDALCAFLADFPYQSCPPFGWWQMWGGGHALDGTMQEMHNATAQLPDDEYLALIKAFKSRRVSVHERGDDAGGHDGGQGAAE